MNNYLSFTGEKIESQINISGFPRSHNELMIGPGFELRSLEPKTCTFGQHAVPTSSVQCYRNI